MIFAVVGMLAIAAWQANGLLGFALNLAGGIAGFWCAYRAWDRWAG